MTGIKDMKINLRAVVNSRLEINFHSSLYNGTAVSIEKEHARIKLLKSDLGRMLSKNMKCEIEFANRKSCHAVIRDITRDNGWLMLQCTLLTDISI